MAREAFARQEKYGYIELCELIQEMLEVKERTAKGYIRYMREKGEKGYGMSRSGEKICEAEVVSVRTSKAFDHTNLLTIKVPADMAMKARFYRKAEA